MLDDTIAVSELRHRVANDLQIIGGLVEVARRATPEEAHRALTTIAERLGIIGSVHRALCPASIETKFSDQLSALCSQLIRLHGRADVAVDIEVAQVEFGPALRNTLALIIAELVSNALKHAFPGRHGLIRILLEESCGELALTIADDGRGLVDQPSTNSLDGVGLRIVQMLVAGLGGVIEGETTESGGCCVRIDFLTPVMLRRDLPIRETDR